MEIITSAQPFSDEIISGIDKYIIDLNFPTFNVLADEWYKELGCEFEVLHDDAKAIDFWKSMIMSLADSSKMEQQEVGYGSNKMTYPLKFTKLDLVNSKEYKLVQLADLVASSLCYGLKERSKMNSDEFVNELWKSKLFDMEHKSMVPLDGDVLMELIEVGEQEGVDSLDYLAEMRYKNRNS